MPTTDSSSTRVPRPRRRGFAALAVALVVIASAGIVAASAFDTAGARISGSTENSSSLLSAGRIDLVVGSEDLLFDADGLYPGLVLDRCLTVAYVGSIDEVDIRLTVRRSGSDGLERFLRMTVETGEGADPDCSDFSRTSSLADGLLVDLWTDHGSFPDGLVVGDRIAPEFETTVRVSATVIDDNEAQGLDADFWVSLEARP